MAPGTEQRDARADLVGPAPPAAAYSVGCAQKLETQPPPGRRIHRHSRSKALLPDCESQKAGPHPCGRLGVVLARASCTARLKVLLRTTVRATLLGYVVPTLKTNTGFSSNPLGQPWTQVPRLTAQRVGVGRVPVIKQFGFITTCVGISPSGIRG